MIIAWDPGEKNIGCAMFSYNEDEELANLLFKRTVNKADMYKILEMAEKMLINQPGEKHTFVIENFRIDPLDITNRQASGGRANPRRRTTGSMYQWDEVLTSQTIGALKYAAFRMNQSHVIMQEPGILTMGRKWCDFKIPKGHLPDDISAYIHGVHYMIKAGLITSTDQIIHAGQSKLG